MFLPLQDPTAHRSQLVSRDQKVIKKIHERLFELTTRIGILDAKSSPIQISAIPQSLCITHHGTVALEMINLSTPVLYTICAPFAQLGISRLEISVKNDIRSMLNKHKRNIFNPETMLISKDILYGYVYFWQFSNEILIYKMWQRNDTLQSNSIISLNELLKQLEARTRTINEILPPDLVESYRILSRLTLNNYDMEFSEDKI